MVILLWILRSLQFDVGIDGQTALKGPIEEVAVMEAEAAEDLLRHLDITVYLNFSLYFDRITSFSPHKLG